MKAPEFPGFFSEMTDEENEITLKDYFRDSIKYLW